MVSFEIVPHDPIAHKHSAKFYSPVFSADYILSEA